MPNVIIGHRVSTSGPSTVGSLRAILDAAKAAGAPDTATAKIQPDNRARPPKATITVEWDDPQPQQPRVGAVR